MRDIVESVVLLRRNRPHFRPGSFLARLPVQAQEEMAALGTVAGYDRNTVITREGDTGLFVLLLLSGCVKVTGMIDRGRQSVLALRVGGDILGEMAVVDGGPRSATLTAHSVEPCAGVVIDQESFTGYLADHRGPADTLTQVITGKLRSANRRRAEYAGYDVKTRTARVLAALADTYGTKLPGGAITTGAGLSQADLATFVGASPPSVQKALQELRSAGLIATRYRWIDVRDLPRLRAVGGLPSDETSSF